MLSAITRRIGKIRKAIRFRFVAPAVVLVALIILVPRIANRDQATDTPPPTPIRVAQQDIQVTIPAVGTIDYGSILNLEFNQAGVLSTVAITAGDTVSKGQTLASLESSSLQRALDNAAAALDRAQLDLATLVATADPSKIRLAELDLREAESALADLISPAKKSAITSGESAVASARSQVLSAQNSLNNLLAGATDSAIADAQSSLASAQANLVSAQSALTDTEAGATDLSLQAARDKVAATREASTSAKRALTEASNDHPRKVAEADAKLATAKAEVTTATTTLADLRAKPTSTQLQDANTTLEQARLTHADAVRTGSNLSAEQKERASVVWAKAQRDYTDAISPATADDLSKAESKLTAAKASRTAAQATVDDMATGPDLAALQDAVTSAERNQAAAELELKDLEAGATTTDLASRRANVASATTALKAARARFDALTAEPEHGDVRAAEQSLTASQASLADAQARLADTLDGADASEIRKAKAAVSKAEITLADLRSPADPLAVKRQELSINDAERQLEAARDALADASLLSPINGVVLTIEGEVGERVSGPLMRIGVSETLLTRISIDETDIGSISIGQPVTLSFQALDDRTFDGSVAWIAAQGTIDQGLVTFAVDISVDNPTPDLRAGLTSDVQIIVDGAQDVIAVPKAAIQNTPRGPIAFTLQDDDTVQPRRVTTGISNAVMIQITSGLEVGDFVMPNAAQAAANLRNARGTEVQRQGPGRGVFGGGPQSRRGPP